MKTFSVLLLSFLVAIPGCGSRYFTPRAKNPVTEDYIGKGLTNTGVWGIASSTASRRTAYMRLHDLGQRGAGELCAEPPPDVAEAFTSAFIASLGGSLERQTAAGVELDLALASTLATQVAALLTRSQGLQFARDQNAALCIDYLNRAIDGTAYLAEKQQIRSAAERLINAELAHVAKLTPEKVLVSGKPYTPAELAQIIETLRKLQEPGTQDGQGAPAETPKPDQSN